MMQKTNKPNFTILAGGITKLRLTNGHTCIIDTEDIELINLHKWKAKKSKHCWYACRSAVVNGTKTTIYLHRWLACTPKDLDCHHINHDNLDDRRFNLLNCTKGSHQLLHTFIRITKST